MVEQIGVEINTLSVLMLTVQAKDFYRIVSAISAGLALRAGKDEQAAPMSACIWPRIPSAHCGSARCAILALACAIVHRWSTRRAISAGTSMPSGCAGRSLFFLER